LGILTFFRDDKIVGYITVAMNSLKPKLTDLCIDNYGKINYPALCWEDWQLITQKEGRYWKVFS